MLRIRIIAMGRLKDRHFADGCAEYQKRLGAFCRLDWIELREERLPDRPSDAQIASALEAEGRRILEYSAKSTLISLCVEGEMLTSEQLSAALEQFAASGCADLSFAVGSSYGLSESVKRASALRLSMSRMTFAHQLARLMLCEQLYRALSIGAGGKYHK